MEKLVKKESDSCLDCIFCINTLEYTFCKRFLIKEKDCKGFVYILREEIKKSRGKIEKLEARIKS
jgi:hypothetical protein